jgi:hypothetical protein
MPGTIADICLPGTIADICFGLGPMLQERLSSSGKELMVGRGLRSW